MKQVYWRQVRGNKYRKQLSAAMLNSGGCTVEQTIKLVAINQKETIQVKYDFCYVAERINIEILQPLKIQSLPQLIDLMTQVWQFLRSSNRQVS